MLDPDLLTTMRRKLAHQKSSQQRKPQRVRPIVFRRKPEKRDVEKVTPVSPPITYQAHPGLCLIVQTAIGIH